MTHSWTQLDSIWRALRAGEFEEEPTTQHRHQDQRRAAAAARADQLAAVRRATVLLSTRHQQDTGHAWCLEGEQILVLTSDSPGRYSLFILLINGRC